MDLAINSLPDGSVGYSPFFLDYDYHPTIPADLQCGKKETSNETIGNFCKRLKEVWHGTHGNMQKAVALQAKYYNERHKMINFEMRNYLF